MAFLIASSAVLADLAVSFYKKEIKENASNADYYFDHLVAAVVSRSKILSGTRHLTLVQKQDANIYFFCGRNESEKCKTHFKQYLADGLIFYTFKKVF